MWTVGADLVNQVTKKIQSCGCAVWKLFRKLFEVV
jgi:hypothetical protein